MDPLCKALILFRKRQFEQASTECDQILAKNPYDQAAWCLKLRCLTEQVYVDEVENDEEGIAEAVLDDNQVAQVARPGTSLLQNSAAAGAVAAGGMQSQAFRPRTQTGRLLSGVVRPGTQAARPGTMEQALRNARTARTARPVTSQTGRYVRLGTASMLSNPDGPFVNVSRLNFSKYAAQPTLAKPLFEYLFFHENDALQLAALATQASQFKDWYWKAQLGKCYYRLALYRDAEKQFKSALSQQPMIDIFLFLGKVYIRLDQPLTAVQMYKQGLEKFPNDTSLLTAMARIYENLSNLNEAVKFYKDVLRQDSTNIEAIACIATNHFYSDQPEIAVRFYRSHRRLLQMGVFNSEIFANIGLCCFYSQQFDLAMACMERALSMSDNDTSADIWYNVGHIALGCGDMSMAFQAFKLAIAGNQEHAESYCNLGVLEMRKGHTEQARALLQTAMKIGGYTYEPFYNYALLCHQIGDLQSSYMAAKKSLEIFPEHSDSKQLFTEISRHFSAV